MNISVGIVGLPNVGKSTLFNALLKKQAAFAEASAGQAGAKVGNYAFTTIEPNVGIVAVPDYRLTRLAEITKAEVGMATLPPIKPATVEFVDIAGLVKGASEGAGLGNKFLSHIREVKIIAHVVRAFENSDIVREGSVDPKTDYETIRTELALADLSVISNIKNKKAPLRQGSAGQAKPQIKNEKELLEKLFEKLNGGGSILDLNFTDEESAFVRQLNLLTSKPEIIVLNVPEADYTSEKIPAIIEKYSREIASPAVRGRNDNFVVICAKIEEELAALDEGDQKQYLSDLGLSESGLERLIKKAYGELGLISFLTCGEKEVRAWTVKKGSTAPEAAGEIHTDFIKNFIKAEVVAYDEFVSLGGPASPDPLRNEASERASRGGWKAARTNGKARMEGRDYIITDGDVIEFKIGR